MAPSSSPVKVLLATNLLFCLLNILWGIAIFNFDKQSAGTEGASLNATRPRFDEIQVDKQLASTRTYYAHDNRDLPSAEECTDEQLDNVTRQLLAKRGGRRIVDFTGCPEATWIDDDSLLSEGEAAGGIAGSDASVALLGISVGCNKGHDALRMARQLSNDPIYDAAAWRDVVDAHASKSICSQERKQQANIAGGKRKGEVHCIEPLPKTFALLEEARRKLALDGEGFVLTHAAISGRGGAVKFPDGGAGDEYFGIDSCDERENANATAMKCVEVPAYSLDGYVERFVRSTGPVSMLQIDAEGYDFDVLFGASSVLDRTRYVEFEYHDAGRWRNLHLPDVVRLLDGKGFTCYWAGRGRLWRITGCYLEFYDRWHGWSNVACAHRSHRKLADRMEGLFEDTIVKAIKPPPLDPEWWCGTCSGGFCDQRKEFLVRNERYPEEVAMMRIMESGHCIDKGEDR